MSCSYETEWCKKHAHCEQCVNYESYESTGVDLYELLELEKPNFNDIENPFIRKDFGNSACDRCPNNPNNGGTGICFCTLGLPVIY